MKNIFLLVHLALSCLYSYCQTVIVADNFNDRSKFIDNTLLTIWGGNGVPVSGIELGPKTDNFGLTYNGVSLTSAAITNSGYTSASSLKTMTAIDYEFPSRIDRSSTQVKVEFDAIWGALDGSGESGRLVVTLVDEYPDGGATLGQVDDVGLTDPFGKPVYNIRLRNKSSGGKNALMLYGAGTSTNPEWEKYGSGPWWLPGFSVQSGGGSPGSGTDYPFSGTICSYTSTASATRWKHFTWVIKPERLEVYQRNSIDPASSDVLAFFMEIPTNSDPAVALSRINAAHGTSAATLPPYYNWFGYGEAIRFYFRGAPVNAWLANVTITSQPTSTLPLKLSAFKVNNESKEERKISWSVEDPTSAKEFIIEQSYDGRNFQKLSTIESQELISQYSFLHRSKERKSYYRLKLVEKNGNFFYSQIIESEIPNSPSRIRLYPNPTTGILYVDVPDHYSKPLVLRVYDFSGKFIQANEVTGRDFVQLIGLREGIYLIEVLNNNEKILSQRIQLINK
ncbi:MAG: T9SS type A sorting domain-containing protein [Chitinophagaceae bacterium]|nr:T9SS type A sorting domain-containing protein [Chitinophagaceae bacterium]